MKKKLIALCALSLSLGACTDLTYEGEILSWTVQEPESPVPGDETTDPSQGTTKPDPEKPGDGGACVLNETCHVNPPGNDECPEGDETCQKDECPDGDESCKKDECPEGDETCKKDECPEGDETCKKDECPDGGEDCPSVPETPEPPEDSCENEKSRERYAKGLNAAECEAFCNGKPQNCVFYDIRTIDDYNSIMSNVSEGPGVIRFVGKVVLGGERDISRIILKNKLIIGVPWVLETDKTSEINGDYALITSDQAIKFTLLDELENSTVRNIHLKYDVESNQRAVFSKNLTNTSVHNVVFEGDFTTGVDRENIGGLIAEAECNSGCTLCEQACTNCDKPCTDNCSESCRIHDVEFKGKMEVLGGKTQIGGIIGKVEGYELNNVTFGGTLWVDTDVQPNKDDINTQIKNVGGIIGQGKGILLNNASFYGDFRAAKAYSAVGGVIGYSDNSKLMNCVAGSNQRDEAHIVKYRNYGLKKVNENSEYILERGAERVAHGAIIQATIAKNVGGIVGDMKGGEINNKDVEASVIRRIEGTNNVGGVVGAVNNDSVSTTIQNVKNIVSQVVDGGGTNPQGNPNSVIGGFVGYGKNLSIENCSNIVDGETKYTGDGADNSLPGVRGLNYVGGFAGELAFLEDNEISNILNEVVRVKTESKQSNGGFIGHVEWRNSKINNVVSLIGEIITNPNNTETKSTGGFIGRLENFENVDKPDISQIVSIIDTIESSNAGGFIGEFTSNPNKLFKMHTIFSMTEMLTWKHESAGFINNYAPSGYTKINDVVSVYHKRFHSDEDDKNYYNGYYSYLFNLKYDDNVIKNYTSFSKVYYYKFEDSDRYGTIRAFSSEAGLPSGVASFDLGHMTDVNTMGWLKTRYKIRNENLLLRPMPMPFVSELEALLIKPQE